MPAYAIGKVQMRDPSWVEEYGAKIQPLLKKHGGRYLVRAGKMETLEGTMPLPSVMVVLEFPTMEHARAWFQRLVIIFIRMKPLTMPSAIGESAPPLRMWSARPD